MLKELLTTKEKEVPTIMILGKCRDGHMVEMYPQRVGIGISQNEIIYTWECPRCEKNGNCRVEVGL